jgi:hypothetical protein
LLGCLPPKGGNGPPVNGCSSVKGASALC